VRGAEQGAARRANDERFRDRIRFHAERIGFIFRRRR
jgi:hypothetical protein